MSHEKPHRRLSLTQPTAVPTHPAREESLSPEVRDLERSVHAELSAIRERMDDWDFRLLRLVEAMERATTIQRVSVTRTLQSAGPDATTVFPRQTAPATGPAQREGRAEPADNAPTPTSRERRVRISARTRPAGKATPKAEPKLAATPAPPPPDDMRGRNGTVRVQALPVSDPPLDRVRILVRDTNGGVDTLSARTG